MVAQQINSKSEEVEGIGLDTDSHLLGDYPLDSVLIRTESRTVHDILRRIEQGQYIMDPEFQRTFVWNREKQSRLIESVLMRIPLPVFYFAEDEQGRMIVVDGLQRLSTFKSFLNKSNRALRLMLPKQPDLHRKQFKDLPPRLQNRVEDCNLILYIIDAKAPEQARLDIFERVNGGEPLTRQQMRNCLYMGQATRFLKRESEGPLFLKATGGGLKPSTMRDREFINRFCGFQLFSLDEYRGDMDDFLAETLKRMNSLKSPRLRVLSQQLRTGLANNLNVFGEHAFRKHTKGQERRSVINASLWDVMVTGLSHHAEDKVTAHAADLRYAFHQLMQDNAFVSAITYSTNDLRRVKQRFESTGNMFREVFSADSA